MVFMKFKDSFAIGPALRQNYIAFLNTGIRLQKAPLAPGVLYNLLNEQINCFSIQVYLSSNLPDPRHACLHVRFHN
jgi:hypothetical protein